MAPAIPPALEAEFGQSHLLIRAVDLADVEATRKAMAAAAMRFGGIDVLVNVAGGFPLRDAARGRGRHLGRAVRDESAHGRGELQGGAAGAARERPGRIINIGAGAAAKGRAGMGAYTASKAGVQRLTESLADELKDRGVTVNAILPGTIDTPRNRADMPNADFSRWVPPAAIAEVILFLASDAASAVTGAAIPVTGCWIAAHVRRRSKWKIRAPLSPQVGLRG